MQLGQLDLFVFCFYFYFIISHFADTHTRERALLCASVISAEISTVICDKVEKAEVLLENVERKETPCLKKIILMDAFDCTLVERAIGCKVFIQALQEVEV